MPLLPSIFDSQAGVNPVEIVVTGKNEGVRSRLIEALVEGWKKSEIYTTEEVCQF